jgi:hypothetical protein
LKIFQLIEHHLKSIQEDAEMLDNDINVTHFSDSMVISYNITNKNQLVFILMALRDMTIELAKEGIFLRGAITRGEFFHEANKLFGPALVEAYELESQVATYPRIIISRDVLWYENFSKELETASQENIKEFVTADEMDGWHYVDYIQVASQFTPIADYFGYIEKILQHISEQLDSHVGVKIKYAWLNRKINQALQDLIENAQLDISVSEQTHLSNLQKQCKENAQNLYSSKKLN